ncbi:enoyl-CoA hydratase/isomerase family protein [Burkholderia plantarii]|uniref:enoyl-CoA hydratase/isomerase family protein n=1 Tax=Burkholderia plantarii TaxID=41899 RepID=UPI0006D89FC8|nr:enoyl-CoA hydratase/isomerase family protein [Burkholderia plantarii]ALK34957.1 enoyl-CoA hydratase/isomerase [Burkholderia plantarii]WLE61229.1 enoyl-CoA hydratase/isomerase family protein [Burkholderia plantarii]GLZ18590.1 enoyl-CoA hydratase [Burkholderia plantarii]
MSETTLVKIADEDGIRVITLDHESRNNPFSAAMEDSIRRALREADQDDTVGAIVVTGGEGRSFSAGGDFNEVKNLTGGDDVDRWIDRVTELYAAVLRVSKPTVAAVDHYAIGMGFQFALMFDWRVVATRAEFRMPELRHGIGCSMGGTILNYVVGFSTMQKIIYECDGIPAARARDFGFVNELVEPPLLLARAKAVARQLAGYPRASWRATKVAVGQGLLDLLHETADRSKAVHRVAFTDRSAQQHFARVLGAKYQGAAAAQ